ncbi:Uncharacterized OsmC-related protein [Alkalibacterium subtropicum]|uniref:Uncharacterized OsmC-related protein n=1 Tax=Alkalibacterium subtropicum TaxID=753702 RepID=A0A1I1FWH2_9LACT|nr:OsmC family protein [Alkalibacterium subtropicum]SFC01978.1 Uncharacterized OsmC-related protein [Alkalibacterium subtropicum]
MSKMNIKASAESMGGMKVKATASGHELIMDEPESAGGTDQGMNPMEALLSALGGCKCIVAQAYARAHEINLKSIRIDFEGEFDPSGYLGKDPNAKIGYSKIIEHFHIEADNTIEEINDFITFVSKMCPVHDTLRNPATFEHTIHLNE